MAVSSDFKGEVHAHLRGYLHRASVFRKIDYKTLRGILWLSLSLSPV